jgi:hypothetical protein
MAQENDIVLIYYEDQPAGFARIEAISPDVKKDWYHVTLLLLQVPLQTVTWILRDVYINGEEFTMGGNRLRLEKVEAPPEVEPSADSEENQETPVKDEQPAPESEKKASTEEAKVVSLWNRQSKK